MNAVATLDDAQDNFRHRPNRTTAQAYREALLSYWFDEMIGDETLLRGLQEIRDK